MTQGKWVMMLAGTTLGATLVGVIGGAIGVLWLTIGLAIAGCCFLLGVRRP